MNKQEKQGAARCLPNVCSLKLTTSSVPAGLRYRQSLVPYGDPPAAVRATSITQGPKGTRTFSGILHTMC